MTHGAAAAAVLTAIAFVGCGGDDDKGDPIPRRDANRMVALLDLADRQSAQGTCGGARSKVREAREVAEGLPEGVDPDVRRELGNGFDRLDELIDSECSQVEEAPEETTTTDAPTTTTPEPTTTTPEPTTTTPEPAPEPTNTTVEPEPTTPEPQDPPGTGGTPPGQADDG